MQPLSREQLNRNRYLRATSFEGKQDLGDTFRRARGDRDRVRASAMAPIVDEGGAGENRHPPFSYSAAKIVAATLLSPSPASASEDAETDALSSSSSSPPTHPAFFSSATKGATRREAARAGKENAGLAASAVPLSPSSSPWPRKPMAQQKKTAVGGEVAGPVVLGRLMEDLQPGCREDGGGGGGSGGRNKKVLGNIDTNLIAVQLNDSLSGSSGAATSKKNKRKSKKTNGADGTDTNGLVYPTSYAEAVKEDPAAVEKREAEEAEAEHERQSREGSQNSAQDGADDAGKAQPTPAGNLTFAEAVKEDPVDSGEGSQAREQVTESASDQKKSEQLTPAFSQASTSIDYPDINSDSDDEEEEKRRRDKEKAPQVLGTRWAPVRVPFKRRLQTAAVLMHCLGIGLSLSIFFFFCAFPPFWPIIIIYLFTILFATDATDGKLKKRKEWVRRLPIWTFFAEYFPARLHKTHDLQPTRKYIFGYHPHGIISHGAWAAFATEALGFAEKFPGITNSLLTLDSNFRLPLYREYVFSMGVLSVSKESITNILTRGGPNNEGMGRAVTIVVGGARESLEAQPETMRLIINERKGFVKLALQTGADLVPVIAFGENDLYDQLDPHRHPWLHGLQRYFLKAWKFTVPLLHGRGIFNYDVGLMPYRRPLNIVVGKPIPVVQNYNPENSEVNRLHDLYTDELQKIWDRYKNEFAADRKEEMQFLD